MSSGVLIRKADSDDAAAIAELLDELSYPAEATSVRERLALVARDENGCLLVAVRAGEALGMVGFHAIPLIHEDGRMGRITALVVSERHRGAGIGRALVERVEEVAKRLACTRMEITSSDRRTDAHRFYGALGYGVDAHLRFLKRL